MHPAVVKQQYDTHNVWNFENHWRSELFDCKPMGRCKFKHFILFQILSFCFLKKC
jgi:hypothetical protein